MMEGGGWVLGMFMGDESERFVGVWCFFSDVRA